ncbi:hypothetical protein J2W42_006825 [Rhizobium tibeticum]|uniref:hypothetical protein n=1 Tax=Rhizobium tibeticum TaxID=501024 RepID=UPI002782A75C|nr:hypothetical protein [Rhizobium tibeticum]MDP9813948.1 hypothetical protein [Rhizobium tibeticum]
MTLKIGPKWAGLGDSAGSAKRTLKGEAVVIEVQPGKYLFALLKGYNASTAIETFGIGKKPGGLTHDEYYDRLDAFERSRQTITLPTDKYPLLVSFRDLSNPMSVVAAGPVSFKGLDFPTVAAPRDLSGMFGSGYSVKSITLSIVDDEITRGVIGPILPWLDEYRDKLFDGNTIHTIKATDRLANSLGAGSFRTGS